MEEFDPVFNPRKCDNIDCPINRWGRCLGDVEMAVELGWCKEKD